MPMMDGYEAARMIRQKEQEQGVKQPVIIIAMTANAMAEDRERCLQSGMNDYLSKPLRTAQLTEMLQHWSDTAINRFIEKSSSSRGKTDA